VHTRVTPLILSIQKMQEALRIMPKWDQVAMIRREDDYGRSSDWEISVIDFIGLLFDITDKRQHGKLPQKQVLIFNNLSDKHILSVDKFITEHICQYEPYYVQEKFITLTGAFELMMFLSGKRIVDMKVPKVAQVLIALKSDLPYLHTDANMENIPAPDLIDLGNNQPYLHSDSDVETQPDVLTF
jgi:hypothetical protein